MIWDDVGFLLSKIKYNENSLISESYTKNHGKVTGIIFGGTSRKIKNYLQIGNKIHLNYQSKSENKIGFFKMVWLLFKWLLALNIAIIPLDILIIAEPMNSFENSQLNFPVFISLLDNNDKILETQYFLVSGVMKKNPETNIFVESDITYKLKIVTEYLNTSQIIVGFMLDDKKRLLLD